MSRRVLLLEPNYKNKYPPINLMKLATYYREICKDDVRFFKGDLKVFAAQLLMEEFFKSGNEVCRQISLFAEKWQAAELCGTYADKLLDFIKTGKKFCIKDIPNLRETPYEESLKILHQRFRSGDYPKFDIICVATLFTFEWAKTIDTINFAKKFLIDGGKIYVGGVAATLVPDEIEKETGIKPHIGLLDSNNDLDATNHPIIDTLPLDYSILDEINYKYPANDAYFGYTTRGCVNKCGFCAVPTLEPKYKNYISIREQLQRTEKVFGAKRNLLLLDNNVLASNEFDKIIDEIKACGFGNDAAYTPPNEYEIAINNLRAGFNERACIRKILQLYDKLSGRLPKYDAEILHIRRKQSFLLSEYSAKKSAILEFDKFVKEFFEKYLKHTRRIRYVDFNQGLDARLMTPAKMAKLAEVNIRPMRIAFDHIEQRKIYTRAIKLAAENGIEHLSNYILYNYNDKPCDLYLRLKINVNLCERLNVSIFSFPMKYHPLTNPNYFRNREYIGRHWNRKFIRAIQAILNATKGKVGRGKQFFKKAFGKNLHEFYELLWMPEALIIQRNKYDDNITQDWREIFYSLSAFELGEAKSVIALNRFSDEDIANATTAKVRDVLKFYQITRRS